MRCSAGQSHSLGLAIRLLASLQAYWMSARSLGEIISSRCQTAKSNGIRCRHLFWLVLRCLAENAIRYACHLLFSARSWCQDTAGSLEAELSEDHIGVSLIGFVYDPVSLPPDHAFEKTDFSLQAKLGP